MKVEGKDLVGRATFKIQEKRWRCQVSRNRSDEPRGEGLVPSEDVRR